MVQKARDDLGVGVLAVRVVRLVQDLRWRSAERALAAAEWKNVAHGLVSTSRVKAWMWL